MAEKIEDLLYNGLKIKQDSRLYCFTSDAVVLANFITIKRGESALEIGTGSGVISILALEKNNAEKVTAFEVQKEMFELALENFKLNGMQDKVNLINDRIQNFKEYVDAGSFDVVFANPPYKKEGTAKLNDNRVKAIARHEVLLNLDQLCECTSSLLKFGGRFYVVFDANRSAELMAGLKKHNLEPKEMFYTHSAIDAEASLVVVKAVMGGKEGIRVKAPVITNDLDGKYIENVKLRRL